MIDRETGATTIYTQNAVGTAEPERSTYHSIHERLEFTHRDYAQAEYAAQADGGCRRRAPGATSTQRRAARTSASPSSAAGPSR